MEVESKYLKERMNKLLKRMQKISLSMAEETFNQHGADYVAWHEQLSKSKTDG